METIQCHKCGSTKNINIGKKVYCRKCYTKLYPLNRRKKGKKK